MENNSMIIYIVFLIFWGIPIALTIIVSIYIIKDANKTSKEWFGKDLLGKKIINNGN